MFESFLPSKQPLESRHSKVMRTKSAGDAIVSVDPEGWAQTTVRQRLRLLQQLRRNFQVHMEELSQTIADGRNELILKMKNNDNNGEVSETIDQSLQYTKDSVKLCSGLAPAYHLTVMTDLYSNLDTTGLPLEPLAVSEVIDNEEQHFCDIQVLPGTTKEKLMFSATQMILRVKGKLSDLKRTNSPLEKPCGIVAVLAAGNTASAIEVLKAIFLDNKVVVFKGHPLNVNSDAIWQIMFQPLEEIGAISYCNVDEGEQLCQDPRLSVIYFTGSTKVARSILKTVSNTTDTFNYNIVAKNQADTQSTLSHQPVRVVTECGGVNPVLIVPGIRPWSPEELQNVATHIVSISKFFGGAICGRPQIIVTCQQWKQRTQFLQCVEHAIRNVTPPVTSFYPGSTETLDKFHRQYPDESVLIDNHPTVPAARFLWIPGVNTNDGAPSYTKIATARNTFLCQNEAFCQVLGEYALDTEDKPVEFLEAASNFCNNRLFGSLSATIMVDDETKAAHPLATQDALNRLRYGAISVNGNPAGSFNIPHLIWGGCGEEDMGNDNIETGCGNFGNALGYSNVQKSIQIEKFEYHERGHLVQNTKTFDRSLVEGTRVFLEPSWLNLVSYPINMALSAYWD